MNQASIFYCSDLSKSSQEKVSGTASLSNIWLLLEYPRPWRKNALKDSDLPENIKTHLRTISRTISARILFIRKTHSNVRPIRIFIASCREEKPTLRSLFLNSFEELLDIDAIALQEMLLQNSSKEIFDPLFLVCTHGKHDKCCAKYGLPIYKQLKIENHEVWECSHVGGDRFAANAVCMPHGLFFGHITGPDAREILSAYRNGHIYLKNYRGRSCYPKPVQAAEFFARSESGLTKIDELRFLEHSSLDDKEMWKVKFKSFDEIIHQVILTSGVSSFENYLTCQSSEKKKVIQYELLEYKKL